MNKNNENKQSHNSSDLAQNVKEEKRNEETKKSFENSAVTDPKTKNEPVKEIKEDELDKSVTVTYESHEDNNVAHLGRLRTAMRMIEEEIRHIELRSENIK